MIKKIKKLLKNQKGLTLVELLAVVVILGIISAIAVPSIGNVIENSKKDAHIANAEQLANAARLAKASGISGSPENTYTMQQLITEKYLEGIPESPSGPDYNPKKTIIELDGENIEIRLAGGTNQSPHYFIDTTTNSGPATLKDVTRDNVTLD